VPRLSSFPPPRIERIRRIPDDPLNVTELSMVDGVLIAELVTNVRTLAGRRAEFLFLGLNIVGGDGAPARVIGRPVLD
jgi:kynurenine formamidase